MVQQLLLGSLLVFVTMGVSSFIWVLFSWVLSYLHHWLRRPPHGPRLLAVLMLALGSTLMMMTAAVWIWAFAFLWLGLFASLEEAVYFALVAFTTLGFGDVLLPAGWRLMSGLSAANGLLQFGLMTAMLVETLRETRLRQREARR